MDLPRRGLWPVALLCAAMAVAMAPLALVALDLRPAVIGTESMQPAFGSGDVVVNEVVAPSALHVGDVVTYSDGLRSGALVTERVVAVDRAGTEYTVITQGDASERQEEWTIHQDGEVGRVAVTVPGLGRALAWPSGATAARGVVVGMALVGGVALARRRWA